MLLTAALGEVDTPLLGARRPQQALDRPELVVIGG
jgi:hypothetical protein